MAKKIWLEKQDLVILSEYPLADKDYLIEKLGKSWNSIKSRANKLCVLRNPRCRRLSDLSKLLEETPESYYWIGFLLADGHFKDRKRLVLTLSFIDLCHIKKFSEFINCPNLFVRSYKGINRCSVSAQDPNLVPKIMDKFDLTSIKTYNPPKINNYFTTSDNLLSLIIGFFDGDGCVTKRNDGLASGGSFHVHSSWIENLDTIRYSLYKNFPDTFLGIKVRLGKDGYASMHINLNLLRKLKEKAINLNLPVLSRKWDLIENSSRHFLSPTEVSYILKCNDKPSKISKDLNIKYHTIHKVKSGINYKNFFAV